MLIVPLWPVPNQTVKVVLGEQDCRLNVYEKFYGLFMDVLVAEETIISGVICQNWNPIVRSSYLGFVGDFVFVDSKGASDPTYAEIGDRYFLAYLSADEAAELAAAMRPQPAAVV